MTEEVTVPQKDQYSERTGIQQITPQYLPQATLQYRTFLKRSIVEALTNAFVLYKDKTLLKAKIGIEYQTSHVNFPNIVVKYRERSLKNMGVAHAEWMNTGYLTELVVPEVEVNHETGEAKGLASTSPLKPAETLVKGPGILTGTYVKSILNEHTILLSQKPQKTQTQEIRFKNIFSDKYIPFHHYIYNGDISLEVYGMSSADRDRVSDAIVEVINMGTTGEEGQTFQDRIYATIGASNLPFSEWHFVAINTDLLSTGEEEEEIAPWMPEDVWLYKIPHSFQIMGEFYSLVPEISTTELGLVKEVELHPYHDQYFVDEPADIIPTGVEDGAYHLLPPSAYPEGVIPKADYIPITQVGHGKNQPNVNFKSEFSFSVTLIPQKTEKEEFGPDTPASEFWNGNAPGGVEEEIFYEGGGVSS